MPELRLTGCASRPLLGYLKGLGVLRVVAKQADDDARGRWHNGVFELASALDRDAIACFFLDSYVPTPAVSPWNSGGGLFVSKKASLQALEALAGSRDERFASIRQVLNIAQRVLERYGLFSDTEKKRKKELLEEHKFEIVRDMRSQASDDALDWIDAAVVLAGTELALSPTLGVGGVDGNFDLAGNFAQAIASLLLDSGVGRDRSAELLAASLNDQPIALDSLSLGYLARDDSPVNSPINSPTKKNSLGNRWDIVLGIEGAVLLAAGSARRHASNLPNSLIAPFAASRTIAGYGSAANEKGGHELWLPLWEGWATLPELSTLVREARAQVGGAKRRQASTGLDFARAAGELGVARGINAFERYAILERAGQSNLAVPVGRIAVEERAAAQALRGIDAWLTSARRFGARDECPQNPKGAIRRLEQAAFDFAAKGGPEHGCATLEAIGAAEAALACSSSAVEKLRPLRGAPAKPWVDAADDGTPEFAVAVGLASLRDRRRRRDEQGGDRAALPTMRDYIHGTITDPAGNVVFDPDRSRAVSGQSLVALLAALHARRHLDASRGGGADGGPEGESLRDRGQDAKGEKPFSFPTGLWVPLEAARLFASGQLDERRVLALLRGLVVLDYDRDAREGRGPVTVRSPKLTGAGAAPEPIFELLALAWQPPLTSKKGDPRAERALGRPEPGGNGVAVGARPSWAPLLAAGAIRPVIEDALLRLRMARLPPIVRADDLDPAPGADRDLGRRLSAALLLHLEPRSIRHLVETYIEEKENEKQKGKRRPND